MGCDIHLYVEVKSSGVWKSADIWQYDQDDDYWNIPFEKQFYTGGRNYNLFSALCGVRSSSFYNSPPIISDPKGYPLNISSEVQRMIDRWGTDGHSHNWNSLDELKSFDWSEYGTTCDFFRNEVIPKMEELLKDNEDVRIVYLFDN